MPKSKPKLETLSVCPLKRKRRLEMIEKVLIYSGIVLFVALLVLLNFYFKDLYYKIYVYSKEAIEGDFWTMIGVTFGFAVLFQMLFVPGISFYLIYLGFITKNFFMAFVLIYPFTLLVVVLSYYIARFTLKSWLSRAFKGFIKFRI